MFRFYFHIIKKYIRHYILLIVLFVITNALSLVTPYALKIIIDKTIPQGTYEDLVKIVLLLLGCYIIRIGFSFYSGILYVNVSRKIIADIRRVLYKNLLKKDTSFFKESKTGELIYLLTNDVDKVQNFFSSTLLNYINNSMVVLGVLGVMFYFNVSLTLVSLVVLPFLVINTFALKGKIKQTYLKLVDIEGNIYNYFLERIRNIRVLKSNNVLSEEIETLNNYHNTWRENAVENTYWNGISSNITTFLIAIGPLIILLYGGKLVYSDLMTIGTLIAFIQYLNRIYAPIIGLAAGANEFFQSKVSMKRIYDNITEEENTDDLKEEVLEVSTITLKNITVKYHEKYILKDFSYTFNSGKTYGIKGKSGIGKSTMVNLIMNFINPDSGHININNISIDKVKNLTSLIGLIEKENQLFHDTVINNIKYGAEKENIMEFREIIRIICLSDVIDRLEDHENTTITFSGSTLSDGEKQRIAIARVFYKQPEIIIFDEATASLDVGLERIILKNIREKLPNAIILIISHRNNLHEFCDEIIDFEKLAYENNTKLLVTS
ncbi:ABC transporter ATP-binding protein [Chryseobacterium sp. EO14]|uniref:ABC transporter ATP-binding protein n=1 Tax=Chryseobacterium sp. EO14 TaxID=2950551 RepID=UPI0021096909|nr:ABC transporter ATP-binding protein [Chryseobacterium sp. EO14]MCQ4138686.1 ABC transporter ATP-binding protein/permease [Chryseobacterium sp. EO14]